VAEHSKIEWTDATWNPVRGCDKVSAGCKNCYAETFAERWRGIPGHPFEQGFDLRLVPEKLGEPLKWKRPKRIFVNSMSDLFHEGVPFEYIDRVFAVMALCGAFGRGHTFQILTKRAARMRDYLNTPGRQEAIWRAAGEVTEDGDCHVANSFHGVLGNGRNTGWPMNNVWLGVSVENQVAADERIPLLLQCPAAVRFLSCEPLLGPVDLTFWLDVCVRNEKWLPRAIHCPDEIDWIIAGGESGAHARPMHIDWARLLRDQCKAANVPYFFKQWGEWQIGGNYDEVRNYVGTERIVFNDGRSFEVGSPIDHPAAPFRPKIARKIGKSNTGRLLDGCEWDEFPEATVHA
jgi:protein gp37